MSTTAAISADDFLGTLGVNTHIGTAGAYSDTAMVEQDLSYLGVGIVRDSLGSAGEAAVWQQVAQATGVKFDDYMTEGAPSWDQADLALVPQLAQDGILHSIEGGNEEDDSYAQANGNSLSWTAQFQQQVYAMGQQVGVPVINMSFGSGWTAANNWEGDYPNVGNLSAYTNYANAHTYPNVGQTPGQAIAQLDSDAKLAASSRPVITTEIGWQTTQFSEAQIAQYAVDATFDGIADGNAGTWFYGLYDDSSGDWGLFNSDGSARPAATALHNLTTLLSDTGSTAASFTPGSLNYNLTGTQSGDNSILIEKSNGTYWIGVWNESGSQHNVTVTLPTAASQVEVFDPITGTTAIQNVSNASSVTVSLGADPLLIEVVPNGSTGTTTTTSTSSSSSTTSSSSSSSSSGSSSTLSSSDLAVTVPGAEKVVAGAKLAISGVSVSDAWASANGGNMALNVWDSSGTLTIDGQTFGPGGGEVANGMFSGTLAQINADLATLAYTAGAKAGSDTITIDVWNQAGVEMQKTIGVTVTAAATTSTGTTSTGTTSTGTTSTGTTSTSTSTSTGSSSASLSPTDLAVTVPATASVTAGKATAIAGVSVSDAWGAANGGNMALNLWDTTGTLNVNGQSFGPSGASFSGSLAQINADLASLTYTGPAGSDTITVDVWNQAGVESEKTIAVTSKTAATPPSNTITIASSNANPVENVSNSAITASAGDHMLFIGGTGNTVTLSGGTDTVQAFQGGNSITTSGGNDTIQIGGSGNKVNATGGNVTIQDSGSNNTIVLPGAGHGSDNIYGYVMQNGDKLDLSAALSATSWNGTEGTLSKYLSVADTNNNAVISLSTNGSGAGSAIATLQGAGPVSLATLLQHAIT